MVIRNGRLSCFVVLCALIVLAVLPVRATPVKRHSGARYECDLFLQNIDRVVVAYRENSPFSHTTDWPNTVEETIKYAKKELAQEGITVEARQISPEALFKDDPNALHVLIVWSYVDKQDFSIPPDAAYLATWLEVSRFFKTDTGWQAFALIHEEKPVLSPVITDREQLFPVVPRRLLNDVVCGVMESAARKRCSRKDHVLGNRYEAIEKECTVNPAYVEELLEREDSFGSMKPKYFEKDNRSHELIEKTPLTQPLPDPVLQFCEGHRCIQKPR